MSRLVDTSVVVKWFVIEEDHEKAKALIGETLMAPDLLMAEISNVIWRKWRLGQMTSDQAFLAQSMTGSFVDLVPSRPLAQTALHIGIELDHPVYDCIFLALSESSGNTLLTADERLVRRCRGTRFQNLVEPLRDV